MLSDSSDTEQESKNSALKKEKKVNKIPIKEKKKIAGLKKTGEVRRARIVNTDKNKKGPKLAAPCTAARVGSRLARQYLRQWNVKVYEKCFKIPKLVVFRSSVLFCYSLMLSSFSFVFSHFLLRGGSGYFLLRKSKFLIESTVPFSLFCPSFIVLK